MKNDTYALAIHGGAGARRQYDYAVVEKHLKALAEKGRDMLHRGDLSLDVVEVVVRDMEASGLYVAGKGSGANRSGYVELDASIMDGARRRAGGVAGLRDVVHPISAARKVMEKTPHVLIAGIGATTFALKSGLEFVDDPATYYVPAIGVTAEQMSAPGVAHGTVGAVALDRTGHLAAATSTGGIFGKLEGRVGDTPLIGAGTWADERVAVSCSGVGEYFILAGGAHELSARVHCEDMSLQDAADGLIEAVARLGGTGGVIAVSRTGEIAVAFNSEGMKRATASATASPQTAIF